VPDAAEAQPVGDALRLLGHQISPRNAWALIGLASSDRPCSEWALGLLEHPDDLSRTRAPLVPESLMDLATFCAVERSADDPRRPPGYTPLDAFWARRGYQKHPELTTAFVWKELDEASDSAKLMVFWLEKLVC
jgi:hypothetical protein